MKRRWFTSRRDVKPAGEVVLYTRAGCLLCDEVKRMLGDFGIQPLEVDIRSDPWLETRYGDCVPVVVIDGKERFRGQVERRLLRRALRHRASDRIPPSAGSESR